MSQGAPRVADHIAGLGFVLRTRTLLGAIGLDLFPVPLGPWGSACCTADASSSSSPLGITSSECRLEDQRPQPVHT